ncbi:hypothetical protein HYH02_001609 [Chlamydomonas schloesseri]|uniref:Uncharacterized protein n=1 Tax=Chlamydomonas schloesseri TaxID=2026947 RepID=A0A835WTD8_9CHLO|nr:hypothetical protein HYH02_001609 [Chlamydomonas schloesseri]|eukprot:KAG2453385.1 hypothetical protein HYH02_001609 [Chlamydomonas schloesseri]
MMMTRNSVGLDADDAESVERARLAQLARFTQPYDPHNPLLHDLWEPWARKARFFHVRMARFYPGYSGRDQLHEQEGFFRLRGEAVRDYAYVVPTAEALGLIAEVSGGRVVEVGAGSGYWAGLLARRGVDVVAVDTGEEDAERNAFLPGGGGRKASFAFFTEARPFFPAMQKAEAAQFLAEHGGCPDRALLLCCSYGNMGDHCLAAYRGDTVVAVGEVDGATWWLDTEEHPEWQQLRRVPLPNWPMQYFELRVYKRVAPVKEEEEEEVEEVEEGQEQAEREQENHGGEQGPGGGGLRKGQPSQPYLSKRRQLKWRRSMERVSG